MTPSPGTLGTRSAPFSTTSPEAGSSVSDSNSLISAPPKRSGQRRAKMKLNRFQQLTPRRAPHVNADVSSVAHRGYIAPPVQSAHFPELDADRVHGTGLDVAQSIRRRFNPLVGHNRYRYVLPHERHATNIIATHGLFD